LIASIPAQQSFDISAAPQNTQNQYIFVFNAIENDVIPDGKTPQPSAQVIIAATA
jgi:hypothetical protein